jgi:hypothetical protein
MVKTKASPGEESIESPWKKPLKNALLLLYLLLTGGQ